MCSVRASDAPHQRPNADTARWMVSDTAEAVNVNTRASASFPEGASPLPRLVRR